MQPGAKLRRISRGRYIAATRLHAAFRFRILRRTRLFPGRTSARSLSDRIESIWETPSKERAWPALQRRVLCKEACSAEESALQRSVLCRGESAKESALQRSVLCRGECSAKESALQRRVLCRGECSAKKHALQRSVVCKGECSAKKRALQRSVLCKGECSAKERALQRRVLCKEACSAKKRALQRRVLCKGACSAKESALQRSVLFKGERALQRRVLCKEVCSAKKRKCALQRRVLQRSVLSPIGGGHYSFSMPSGTDNSVTEASLNKLFTTSWPLQLFVQLLRLIMCCCSRRTSQEGATTGQTTSAEVGWPDSAVAQKVAYASALRAWRCQAEAFSCVRCMRDMPPCQNNWQSQPAAYIKPL